MNRRLYTAFNKLDITKKNKEVYIPGILGFTINGHNIVDVPYRPGYVYVRLHSNLNETVQVYNDKVSPVYGLPVLVIRDDIDLTRYRIYGRDTGAYENWQTSSSYVPRHGDGHSFGSGDITWIYDQQFIPLLVYPSGTYGAGNVMIAPDWIWHNSEWRSAGGTGTASLLPYKPTGSSASLVLVSLDSIGNPKLTAGTFPAVNITGGAALLQYLPDPANYDIPLAMVRLVSGTSNIGWDNIYDLRSFSCENITGTSGGGGGASTWELQTFYPDKLEAYTTYARYTAAQSATLKDVVIYYYTGDTGTTNWIIYKGLATLDSWSTGFTDDYLLITRSLDEPLTGGDEIYVDTDANVAGIYAGPATITFIMEKP